MLGYNQINGKECMSQRDYGWCMFSLKLTVDSGKALDDNGSSSQVSRLQGGMLPAGPFSIVLISNYHPVHSTGLSYTGKQNQWKF